VQGRSKAEERIASIYTEISSPLNYTGTTKAMTMLKPTIFLSHSSVDQDLLRRLREFLLRRIGSTIELFLSSDGQSIPFGKNWVREVEAGLERAKVMFTFLSPTALQSQWVLFEADFAYAKGIQVVPIGILGVDLARVSPPLGLLQGFNLRGAPSLGNLLTIINRTFTFAHGEHCTDKEFEDVFSGASKSELSVLGEHSLFFTRRLP
jgi:hypothetical protein